MLAGRYGALGARYHAETQVKAQDKQWLRELLPSLCSEFLTAAGEADRRLRRSYQVVDEERWNDARDMGLATNLEPVRLAFAALQLRAPRAHRGSGAEGHRRALRARSRLREHPGGDHSRHGHAPHRGTPLRGELRVCLGCCPRGFPCGAPQARVATGSYPFAAVPVFAHDLRPLAVVEALDRVVAEASELAELWDGTPDSPKWRQSISRIRAVLAPEPAPQENPLFDL